jgi:hypothetical protein
MTPIEQRYQRLLRAYPGWYREQRGGEMLGTLMEAAPARRWPSVRDTRALVLGGLRVRAGQDQRLGTRENLRLAALLGAVLSLAWLVTDWLTSTFVFMAHFAAYRPPVTMFVSLALVLLPAATAWFAPWWITAPLALAAAGFWLAWSAGSVLFTLQPVGLLVVLAILARGRERLPRHWLILAGALVTISVLQELTLVPSLEGWYTAASTLPWIIVSLVALWSAVDARPALAMAIALVAVDSLWELLHWAVYGPLPLLSPWQLWLPVVSAAALTLGGIWRVRRQAAL